MRARWIVLCALLLVLGIDRRDAHACQCMPQVRCEAVFAGTTIVGTAGQGGATADPEVMETTFVVDETLYAPSALAPRVTIRHDSRSNSCGIAFVTGQRYVVFAHTARGALWASGCGTHAVAAGALDPDIAFARAARLRTTASLSGSVRIEDGQVRSPAAGQIIEIGGPTRRLATDAVGEFRIELAPGTYPVTLRSRELVEVDEPQPRPSIELPAPGACATVHIGTHHAGVLEGRVLARDGAAVARAHVTAVRGDSIEAYAVTNVTGAYRLEALNPGAYRIVVSGNHGHDADNPEIVRFPPTAAAGLVQLGRASQAVAAPIRVPAPKPVVQLRVRLRDARGAREDAFVELLVPGRAPRAIEPAPSSANVAVGNTISLRACNWAHPRRCIVRRVRVRRAATVDLVLPWVPADVVAL